MKSLKSAPDLIVLTEVNPKHSKYQRQVSEFQIQDYCALTSGFEEKGHRGILIYYRDSISILEQRMSSSFEEKLCVKLIIQKKILNILSIYRSPNSLSNNDDKFINMLEEFTLLRGDHLLLGDFNFPNIHWEQGNC